MPDHYDRCLEQVITYADTLWAKVRAGKLRESVVSGLVRSYLQQPAYYPEWRHELYHRAMLLGGDRELLARWSARGTPS